MLRTFETNEESYEKFAELCRKERVKIGAKLNEFIEQYIKEHGDGNPQFTIDQFDDPDFMACPAFYRSPKDWEEYLKKQDPKELEKVKEQIIAIDRKLGGLL